MISQLPQLPKQRGYTLIEVLIAAAILLVSTTGLLTMQLVSIRITQDAYHRTLATSLAYEMTEYVRANCGLDGAEAADYLGYTLCEDGRRNPNDKRACTVGASTDIAADPTTVADDDLRAWWSALADSRIPNWYATIVRQNGVYHVIVQWDDSHATETSGDATEAKVSCLGGALPIPMEEVCLATIPCESTN